MKSAFAIVALAFAVTQSACSGSDDEKKVVSSFKAFQQGLRDSDGAALWGVADDVTRTYFSDFARSIRGTCRLVRENYPQDDRAVTLRSVGGDLEGSARDGKALFMYMLDARKLAPPENNDSTVVREIRFEGPEATVVTRSGESVIFTKNADETWGTRMFLAAFKELPAVVTLRDNIKVTLENCSMLGIDVDAVMSAK